MALNSTLTFQLKSVVQNATFPHKGDFNDGCITYLDVTGTPGNTSFAFNSPPGVTLDCGPHDFHGRFRRYFDGVHNGAAYPASIGYNSASHYAEVMIGSTGSSYVFKYGKPESISSSTTSSSAASSTHITTGSVNATATTDSAASATATSTGDVTMTSASSSVIAPSVVYVAPSNSYVAPKSVPGNLYKGAATMHSFSAAAIVAAFALLF